MWDSALERTRRRFEPRRHAARGRWSVASPWTDRSDPLVASFDHHDRLFRDGRVVWGRFVIANTKLWSPGPHAHPGLVVFGLDPALDAAPEQLDRAARACGRLRDGPLPEEPGLRSFAEEVRDDMARGMGRPVPAGLCPVDGLVTVSTVVWREHVPEGVVTRAPFPLLVDPATWASLVLPWEYWDAALVARWRDSVAGDRRS